MSQWPRLARTFRDNTWQNLLHLCLPNLRANAEYLRANQTDCRLKLTYYQQNDPYLPLIFVFELDGEKSPPLAGKALEVWVCIQWPHAFKMGDE